MILNFFIFYNFLSLAVGGNDKFRIKTYRVTVNVQDRYVRTEVAVQVKNKNPSETQKYEFGVKLDETEFISSLTMRVGKNNRCKFLDDFYTVQWLSKNVTIRGYFWI